jgi:NAD(P)-dependent dehydrogenase (short-subunit alcohol dehydrogenase family)
MQLPDFSVKDRVALLTGAGRGIGLAIARALAAGGAAVAIQDIDEGVAVAEADAINRAGGRAMALGGDASDLSIAETLVNKTVEQFGGLHILVNNAAVQKHMPFLDYPLEEMQRQLNANILLTTRLCQLAIPHMQAAKWGRILNIGSVQGRHGNTEMPAYAMSKAALENLTRALGRKFGRDGITANNLAPGYFDTYRNANEFQTPQMKADRGKGIPAGRVGDPEDCAGLAILLCSRAGEYINGQTIYVDGGITAR